MLQDGGLVQNRTERQVHTAAEAEALSLAVH